MGRWKNMDESMEQVRQTEIQFLLDIILETKTITEVRRKCKERIGVVESNMVQQPTIQRPRAPIDSRLAQAPSTLAALERQTGEAIPMAPVATTQAAAAALAARAEAIAIAASGKEEKGRTSPRKF